MTKSIYLDNHTTTRLSEASFKEMEPFFRKKWGHPMAPHRMGQELLTQVDQSLSSLYRLLGANKADTLLLTSSGAEAVNHAILATYLDVTRQLGKNHFITSAVDEAPIVMSMGRLESLGCVMKMADVDTSGRVSPRTIAEAMTPRTALVSLSWANGMTGVVQPIAEIAELCRARGALLHLDITHGLGKLFLDLNALKPDFLSFNGDSLHGPQGTGVLYIRAGLVSSPLIIGGAEQGGCRGGSWNVPGLVGLTKAVEEMIEYQDLMGTEIAMLRDRLEEGIQRALPQTVIFYRDVERLPNCSVIGFPGISSDAMLFALNRKNLFASFGGGNFQKLSLLLTASGVEEALANTAIHFSLSKETTAEEIDLAIECIASVASQLNKLSEGILWEEMP